VAPVQPSEVASRSELIGHVDRELIAQALERADYDVEKAAAAVGLSRSQLYRVMKRHGIAPRKRSK
jgi:DNA-binding NtrC family response regulator